MSGMTRRQFGQRTLDSLLTFTLLETLIGGNLLADEVKPVAAKWLADIDQLGRDIKGEKVEQVVWHAKVEELLAKVDLNDLLAFINFDNLTKDLKFRELGARSLNPKFPQVEGLPTDLVFGRQIFALQQDRSVEPHGHNNMATAFIVIKGEFHGRHYDRLESDKEYMILRPTIDRTFKPGDYSTVSDHKDNVHWFKSLSETAFIFNFHVMDVNPQPKEPTGRVYVDPEGEALSDNRIRAKRIGAELAHKKYG
jgi:hypothetical protein